MYFLPGVLSVTPISELHRVRKKPGKPGFKPCWVLGFFFEIPAFNVERWQVSQVGSSFPPGVWVFGAYRHFQSGGDSWKTQQPEPLGRGKMCFRPNEKRTFFDLKVVLGDLSRIHMWFACEFPPWQLRKFTSNTDSFFFGADIQIEIHNGGPMAGRWRLLNIQVMS